MAPTTTTRAIASSSGNRNDMNPTLVIYNPTAGRSFDWRAAVAKIARAETRLFDVGRIVARPSSPDPGASPRYFVNNMDIGFGAQGALKRSGSSGRCTMTGVTHGFRGLWDARS